MHYAKFVSAVIFATLFQVDALGKVPLMTLAEMIAGSRYVVEAEVVSVVPVDADVSIATIRVQTSFVGQAPKEIAVRHHPKLSVSPSFAVGERCVFFVGRHQGQHVLVNGYAGKSCRVGEDVDMAYVMDIKPNIGWAEWLQLLRERGAAAK